MADPAPFVMADCALFAMAGCAPFVMADRAPFVMAGLDPAILRMRSGRWLAGSSPAMTKKGVTDDIPPGHDGERRKG